MASSTRAWLALSLCLLVSAMLLHVLALAGVAIVWSAMVHLTLFGWITAMITTITYHTTPVFSGRDFPNKQLAWYHLGAFAAGVALAGAGLLARSNAATTVGVALQVLAALLFAANIALLLRRGTPHSGRPPLPPIASQPQVDRVARRATRLAGPCLLLALLLLLGAYGGWLHGEWALAAEHLAALGWIMLTVVGVAYHMLPRFNGRGVRGPGWARAQLACHLAALLLMVPALGFGLPALFAAGGLMMSVAVGLFVWTIWPALELAGMPQGSMPLVLKERLE